jgi:hypothetical protein
MLNIAGKETDFRSKDGPTIQGGVQLSSVYRMACRCSAFLSVSPFLFRWQSGLRQLH